MANIAFPGVAVTCRALLACVSRASMGLSQRGVGVEPLFCLAFWDRGRACAKGEGGYVAPGTVVLHGACFGQGVPLWAIGLSPWEHSMEAGSGGRRPVHGQGSLSTTQHHWEGGKGGVP